jgi:hypothetical protein
MEFSVTFQGKEVLIRKFQDLPDLMQVRVKRAMERSATRTVAMMKRLCPVRTGALRASIGWTWGPPPSGTLPIGKLKNGVNSPLLISIYAGGTAATKRFQYRSSGNRRRDHKRKGSFETDVARLVEFGTMHAAAQPFFYPSWRVNRPLMRDNVRSAVRYAARQMLSK